MSRQVPPPEVWPALIAAAAHVRARALVATLLYTGARLSAAAALTVGDVEPESEQLRLGEAGWRDLHPRLATALLPLLDAAPAAPLFRTAAGGRIGRRQLRRWVAATGRRAGRPGLTPSDLRAGFGIALWRRSGDVDLVQECLGHGDSYATRRFLRRRGFIGAATA